MANNQFTSLRKNSDFLELKTNGLRYWPAKWMLFNFVYTADEVKIGFTLSRKTGNAVVRNRMKRWCREYCRTQNFKVKNHGFYLNIIFKPIDVEFYKNLEHKRLVEVLDVGFQKIAQKQSKTSS